MTWNALASGSGDRRDRSFCSTVRRCSRIRKLLWRIAAEERVTIFGTEPKFLTTCEQQGLRPREEFDLSALRTVISSGAPAEPGTLSICSPRRASRRSAFIRFRRHGHHGVLR